jgi:2-amino-4-hydroxy-6-hydroxymethyldihydropteridine diphosphokinase
MSGPIVAYIALGANLRDRLAAMRAAVSQLSVAQQVDVDVEHDIASLYETAPVQGPPAQGDYLNSVIRVRTTLSAGDLLAHLLEIEAALGRERRERWASRVIDLDLLLFGDAVIDQPGLRVPHPHLHERRFVLEPLAEIAGQVVHPITHWSIAELAKQARRRYSEQHVARLRGPEWAKRPAGLKGQPLL